MQITRNRFFGTGLACPELRAVPWPSTDAARPLALLKRCPRAAATALVGVPSLASAAGVADVIVKDERDRMGLGSFKALGAAYVIARDAEAGRAKGTTYVTASAGNHGLSVAAGTSVFGARAVVYIAETVPDAFAARLREWGADVVRQGADYAASMAAAAEAAKQDGAVLLSDSSWAGYVERPLVLMEGYLALMDEVFHRIGDPPSHVFLQAGVGGLAGACAAIARQRWGGAPAIVVVEPDAAPALAASIGAGRPVVADGPVSAMGRLDCKEPSLIALKGLARDVEFFATLTEAEGAAGADLAAKSGFPTTPSGAAGLAGLLAASAHRAELGLDAGSRLLVVLS